MTRFIDYTLQFLLAKMSLNSIFVSKTIDTHFLIIISDLFPPKCMLLKFIFLRRNTPNSFTVIMYLNCFNVSVFHIIFIY